MPTVNPIIAPTPIPQHRIEPYQAPALNSSAPPPTDIPETFPVAHAVIDYPNWRPPERTPTDKAPEKAPPPSDVIAPP